MNNIFKKMIYVIILLVFCFLSYKKSEIDSLKNINSLNDTLNTLKLYNNDLEKNIVKLKIEIEELKKHKEELIKENKIIINQLENINNDNIINTTNELNKKKLEKLENNNNDEKIIYLTFDDGPTSNTLKILDILKLNNIKATFFVLGYNSDLYSRIVQEGHTIALHSFTHKYSEIYKSVESYFEDLYKLENLIFDKVGIKSKVVRLPGGSSTNKVNKDLKDKILNRLKNEGYVYFDWNCDSLDASGHNVPVNVIIENSTKCKQKYVNLLMHDTESKNTTVQSLQAIIDNYKERGYKFDVLTTESPKIQHYKIK